MKNFLGITSFLLLISSAWFVVFVSLNEPKESYLTPQVIQSFNVETPPSEIKAPAHLKDAVGSGAGIPVLFPRLKPGLPPSKITHSSRIFQDKTFQALIARPAQFMIQRTLLGKPDRFEEFLKNEKRVDLYLNRPLVRGVLGNGAVLRTLLNQPAVPDAFLTTSAMRNPKTVQALLRSSLLARVAKSLGVKEILKDPVFLHQVLSNPHVSSWLIQNPAAVPVFAQWGPEVAQALRGLS